MYVIKKQCRPFRELVTNLSVARMKTFSGCSLTELGHFEEAADHLEQALSFHKTIGNRDLQYETLKALGTLALRQADYAEAERYLNLCLELCRDFNLRSFEAMAVLDLALVARLRGDFEHARNLLVVTLPILYEVDYRGALANCLMEMAAILRQMGNLHTCVELFGAAEALAVSLGMTPQDGKQEIHRKDIAEVRAQLDTSEFERLWISGAALNLDEAVVLAQAALAGLGPNGGKTRA